MEAPAPADTVSALAAYGAADRWVMTFAFLAAGVFEVATGLALRPAAAAGRLILIVGGVAGVLVAESPEPAAGGGSARHMVAAAIGLVALATWPAGAARGDGVGQRAGEDRGGSLDVVERQQPAAVAVQDRARVRGREVLPLQQRPGQFPLDGLDEPVDEAEVGSQIVAITVDAS